MKSIKIKKFTENYSPEAVYILGLLWADGHVTKNKNNIVLEMKRNDINTLIYLFKRLGFTSFYNRKNRKTTAIWCGNKESYNFLVTNDYKIKSGASADKILSVIPKNLRHYWWRGYFDGDGCIFFRPYERRILIQITSCDTQNWNFVKKLFKKLKIKKFTIRKRIQKLGISHDIICFNKDGVFNFLNYIYSNYEKDKIGLKRKYNIYRKIIVWYKYGKWYKKNNVTWNKSENKWMARIQFNKKRYLIGNFKYKIDAVNAVIKKKIEFGLNKKYKYEYNNFKF